MDGRVGGWRMEDGWMDAEGWRMGGWWMDRCEDGWTDVCMGRWRMEDGWMDRLMQLQHSDSIV